MVNFNVTVHIHHSCVVQFEEIKHNKHYHVHIVNVK